MNFNEHLLKQRTLEKLSEEEAADRLHLGLSAYKDRENGRTQVNFPDATNAPVATELAKQLPDLIGGYVYAGLKQTTGNVYVGPPAAVMLIDRANVQSAKYVAAKTSGTRVDGYTAAEWEGKLRETVRSLEIMRGLYDIFGRTW